MPPLKTYRFKHKMSPYITITLEVYGDKYKAWKTLTDYVANTNDWTL